ncbi:MAG TPA: hypothetical protein VN541_15365 [Tepidisphaeraceae bacterium]|nr:hypothetical protein [Tepidisphaeraceae bacterium]
MQNPNTGDGTPRVNGTLARVAVVACVLLMLALITVMWRQWTRVQEPTTAIVVNADPSLEGTKIVVTPLENESPAKPVEVTLSRENGYRTAIYRYAGRYHVMITVPGSKSPLLDRDVIIDRINGVIIDLPTTVTVIGDGSLADDQVTVTSDDKKMTATRTFTRDNNDRVRFILMTAHYTLSVSRQGDVLFSDSLDVQQHTPQQVDLRKTQ